MAKLGMKNTEPKKNMKSKFKRDPLDDLFSQYIRMRAIKRCGACERCGTPKFDEPREDGSIFPAWMTLQCAHLISRWHKSTRWDEDVALGLCGGCHRWIDHEDDVKKELLISKIGQENYDLLKARSRTPAKYIDKQALRLYYQEKIKELNKEFKNE